MKKTIILLGFCLLMVGCKTVTVHVDDGVDSFKMKVPFAMVQRAISFSDEDVLEIDDLAGVNQEIDFKALAQALRDNGDGMKVHFQDGDSVIHGEVQGQVFNLSIDNPEEEQMVRVNLPMTLISKMADAESGDTLRSSDFLKALRNYSGVLVQVESPEENVKISLR